MRKIIVFVLILLLFSPLMCLARKQVVFVGGEDGVRLEARVRGERVLVQIENIAAPLFTINSFLDSFLARSFCGESYRLGVIYPEFFSCVLTPGEKWVIILQLPEKLEGEMIQSIILYLGTEKRRIYLTGRPSM